MVFQGLFPTRARDASVPMRSVPNALTSVPNALTSGPNALASDQESKLLRFDLQFFADPSKTEEATPRRKEEARKKGQVAKSMELNSVVVLFSIFLILNFAGGWFYNEMIIYLKNNLAPPFIIKELTENKLGHFMMQHLIFFLRIFLPLGLGAAVIAFGINFIQVGALFTIEPLRPKFSKLNPLNGLKRLFSSQGLVDLAKSVLKLIIVIYFAYSTIKSRLFLLLDTAKLTPVNIGVIIWTIVFQVALKVCTFLLILALLDYAYQRWHFKTSLRMTKKEVKDEFKQTEGNPIIKSKIRQRQREIAQRRMMQQVPKADVVITNPTHLAIALRYEPGKMVAPTVVAKGEGYIAQKIKEIAEANGVVLVENKPLAQALYKTVDIGEVVPEKLYQAVAEVLAFVYRLKQKNA
jgi:flagellar biosynthetic protein FlhB